MQENFANIPEPEEILAPPEQEVNFPPADYAPWENTAAKLTPEELAEIEADEIGWGNEIREDISTAYRDETLHYFGSEEIYNSYHQAETESHYDDTPRSPELMSEKLPYRRRQRLVYALQLDEQGGVTAAPPNRHQLRLHSNQIPPFEHTTEIDQDRFKIGLVIGENGPELTRTTPNNELGFIVDHLPVRYRTAVTKDLMAGKVISLSFLWGPKWKISNFGKDNIHEYSQSPLPLESNAQDFHGSNYIAFTSVHAHRNAYGELCIEERLLAEANFNNKAGGKKLTYKDPRYGKTTLDRTLAGLVRRHLQAGRSPYEETPPNLPLARGGEEGLPGKTEPELVESEFLYNQFSSLHEAADLSDTDKAWIEPAFLEFMREQVKDNPIQVRAKKSFKINKGGEAIFDQAPPASNMQTVHVKPLRVNVQKGSFLGEVVAKESNDTHRHLRAAKINEFEQDIYPVWKESFVNQQLDAKGLAKMMTSSTAKISYFLGTKTWRNAAYLIYQFVADPNLAKQLPQGLEGATAIIEALKEINAGRKEHSSLRLENKNMQRICDQIRSRLEEMTTSPEAASIEELIGEEVVEIMAPKAGPVYLREKDRPDKNKDQLLLWKRKVWRPDPDKLPVRDRIVAYDVFPKRTNLEAERENLARVFISYVLALSEEGIYPTSFTMWMDQEPKEYGGITTSGQAIYNAARRLYRNGGWGGKKKESSLVALHRLFDQAQGLIPDHCPKAWQNIALEQLDYSKHPQLAEEARHGSGLIGEIFTHIAVEEALPQLVAAHTDGKAIKKQETIYIDYRRKEHLHKKYLAQFCAERPEEDECRPDFVAKITLEDDTEMELLIDSKAWIKNLTPLDLDELYQHYAPHLTTSSRRLVIVLHATTKKIAQGTPEAAAGYGNVWIVSAETIQAILQNVSPDKYCTALDNEKSLAEQYATFILQPSAFAIKPANRTNYTDKADIIRTREPFSQQDLFL